MKLRTCGLCLRPIHPQDTNVREFANYSAHPERKCLDILGAEIDFLRTEVERLRAAGIKARLALAHAEEKAPGLYIDYYNAIDAALAAKGE